MSERYGLTADNLLASLPQVLRDDPGMCALAAATAEALSARPAEIDKLRIYPRIDELPEELLDILAYDFKVDWWDGDYSLEEKRKTLKDSWRVHRMLGTKAAVEAAISAIYPQTKVQEWFEYGGKPYYFKLQIDATDQDISSARHRRVLERVNFYKNLRSHLDGIRYIIHPEGVATAFTGASLCGNYMRLNVNVRINGTVDRPHVPIRAYSAAGRVGLYSKIEAGVEIRGIVQRPHREIPAYAAAAAIGSYAKVEAAVEINGAVTRPHSTVPVYAGIKPAGEYSKITMEVAVNGLE